ncbi:uncharacterized protein LOC120905723 [Anopheles arabiensis]|uniref:uncharacterized protein LOC120905723 n=1 Tax=Anopheles arabiensis TaxID=7173 RepID=UPI001AADDA69|nr:uncharacterized protein LOC120905723 [Anopheles arabiensis]
MSIKELPEIPVSTVGNFLGESKPASVEEYLRPLVKELNGLMENGIQIANKLIEVRVGAFIADSPARAFIKGVVYFNHKKGCQKCTVEGKFDKTARVMCFPGIDAPVRTHQDFKDSKYGEHHRETTPLIDLLHFDIIVNVIIADLLHLIDFGVTRKVINGWKSGKFGGGPKWSQETLNRINNILNNVEIPLEFHRKLGSIEDTGFWKASEFNMFLNYASFIVLKEVLSKEQYEHFMLYYCAIRLFSSECYREHWPAAHILLVQFVEQYGTLYGEHRITSNVHNLLHVYEDVKKFGALVHFSSYRYEAKLHDVGRSLRNGHNVLVQAANRISEQIPTRPSSSKNSQFPYIESKRYGAVVHINSIITLYPSEQSNWFLLGAPYVAIADRLTDKPITPDDTRYQRESDKFRSLRSRPARTTDTSYK